MRAIWKETWEGSVGKGLFQKTPTGERPRPGSLHSLREPAPQLSLWARTLEDQIPLGLTACPQLGRGPGHHEMESGGLCPPTAACPWVPRLGTPAIRVLGVALDQEPGCASW